MIINEDLISSYTDARYNLKPTILFSGTLKNKDSAELNDNINNYTYADIYCVTAQGTSVQDFTSIDLTKTKRGNIYNIGADGNLYVKSASFIFNESTITLTGNWEWWHSVDSNGKFNSSGDYIRIIKIIGWN